MQDLAYKDIIEPLESVSVSLTPTDKKTIAEYGGIAEVRLPSCPDQLDSHLSKLCTSAACIASVSRILP